MHAGLFLFACTPSNRAPCLSLHFGSRSTHHSSGIVQRDYIGLVDSYTCYTFLLYHHPSVIQLICTTLEPCSLYLGSGDRAFFDCTGSTTKKKLAATVAFGGHCGFSPRFKVCQALCRQRKPLSIEKQAGQSSILWCGWLENSKFPACRNYSFQTESTLVDPERP